MAILYPGDICKNLVSSESLIVSIAFLNDFFQCHEATGRALGNLL